MYTGGASVRVRLRPLVPALAEHDQIEVGIKQLGNFTLQAEEHLAEQRLGEVGVQVGFAVAVKLKLALLVGDVAVGLAGDDLQVPQNLKRNFLFVFAG